MNCNHKTVSRSQVGCVQACACGTISIHCGNGTLRLSAETFAGFARMVDDAFSRLIYSEPEGPRHKPDDS